MTEDPGVIELYGMSSPNVLKVSIMLAELELRYRFHYVNIAAGEQFEPQFLALNPLAKVPVIVDPAGPDGRACTVFESGAILWYLAEKHGRFLPVEARARYDALQWLMLQVANVGPMFGQLTHFTRFAPEGNAYSVSRYRTAAARLYEMLDRRLASSPFLAGREYTIADIATYPWVGLYLAKHGMAWEAHPHLRRWCDAIEARPKAAAAIALYAERIAVDPSQQPGLAQDGIDRVFGWGRYARA